MSVSNTDWQPFVASSTRVPKSSAESRASIWSMATAPERGRMATGRFVAPAFSSAKLRSSSGVPSMNPAAQQHTKSRIGMPASIRASVAALMAAARTPPSACRTWT
eukprot:Amastigsp_a842004_297.p7 type:complete len:106 gc:universal Amastigsp_a842004_297:727-410(-)